MSSSHLVLGLPMHLLVLYFELSSGFHSAALINHLSFCDVAILIASLHFIFLWVNLQHLISSISIFSIASMVLLLMYSTPFLFFDLCSVNFFIIVKMYLFSVFALVVGAARVNVVYDFTVLNFVFRDLFVSPFCLYDETEHFALKRSISSELLLRRTVGDGVWASSFSMSVPACTCEMSPRQPWFDYWFRSSPVART